MLFQVEREVKEELDCDIDAFEVFNDNTHEYYQFAVNLVAMEHSKLVWLRRENLDSLKWAPATVESLIKEVI